MSKWQQRRDVYREAALSYIDTPYPQQRSLTASEFERYLQKRGLTLHLDWFRQSGLLVPLIVEGPLGSGTRRSRLRILDRNWGSRKLYFDTSVPFRDPQHPTYVRWAGRAYYHPFQFLIADELFRRLTFFKLSPDSALFNFQSTVTSLGAHLQRSREATIEFARSEEYTKLVRTVAFLIAIDPIVTPSVLGRLTYNYDESHEDWSRWRRNQDIALIPARFGIDADGLRSIHSEICLRTLDDPLRSWFALIRNVYYEKLERLEGSALRAQTLYFIAEVIRRFGETWLDEEWPEEDDVRRGSQGTEVKKRLYGYHRVTDRRRDVLRRVAREFELDAQPRVTIFLEGDTEIGFVRQFAQQIGLDLEHRGVSLVNLFGHGGLSGPWFRARLKELQQDECFPLVIVDHHPDARRQLDVLAKAGLLPVQPVIWSADIEQDNFSVGELVRIANRLAKQFGARPITVKQVKLVQKPTIMESINKSFAPEFRLDKNEDWGRHLAVWSADHSPPKSVQDEQQERPLITAVFRAFRSVGANYKATVERAGQTSD